MRKESEVWDTNCMNELQKQMNNLELEFTKMVQEYRKTIYTVCYFFSDNPTDVNDLFQEVLVNLWKGFPKFRGKNAYCKKHCPVYQYLSHCNVVAGTVHCQQRQKQVKQQLKENSTFLYQ